MSFFSQSVFIKMDDSTEAIVIFISKFNLAFKTAFCTVFTLLITTAKWSYRATVTPPSRS